MTFRLPKPHQYSGYTWLRENPRGMCLDEMRLGKTYTAAMSVVGTGPGVVACPSSAKSIWRDEFLTIDPTLKIEIFKGRNYVPRDDADVYIINYDVLADNFNNLPYHAKYNWFIPDEFHRLKNPLARRTGAAQALIRSARVVHPLSGTPIPSRPIEWWPVLHALGVTGLDYTGYAYRYCQGWPAEWARNNYCGLDVRGAANLDELRALVSPWGIRRTKAQIFPGYQPPEVKLITFDRPVDRRESQYTPEFLAKFENPLIDIAGLAEIMLESAKKKLPDCVEFIEDRLYEEPKIIVFAWNKEIIAMLRSALALYPSVTITGETSDKQRDIARSEFRLNPSVRILFGNILSAGEAIDASMANVSIFVQTTWVPKDFYQAVHRTESMTKLDSQATAYILTTERSIDHYQLNVMLKKINVIDQVVPLTPY